MFLRRKIRARVRTAIFVIVGVVAGLFSLMLAFGIIGLGFNLLTDGDGHRLNLRIPIACLVCLVGSLLTGSIAKRSFERAIFD